MTRDTTSQPGRWRAHGFAGRVGRAHNGFEVPHRHVWFDTEDGVRLAGTLLDEVEGETIVVLVHGFNGYRTKPRIRILAEGLARRFPVLTFDLRGHGHSGGACTGGELEALDVDAAVRYARKRGYQRVVVVGASLGGIAVIRAAGAGCEADAVVAISTPAQWGTGQTRAVRRMTWVFTSPVGRSMFRRLFGTRIDLNWGNPDPPLEAISQIRVPILIVHGADDHFFPARDAEALFEQANEPKRLLLLPRFGHAEDGFTDAFAAQLVKEIEGLLALAAEAAPRVG